MQRVRDGSNGGRRDEDHDHRQAKDRPDLAPKVTKRVGDRPRVKERRDENEKQDVWWQRDLRQSRDEREKEPADNEHSGIRDSQSLGDEAQPRGDSKEKQNELKGGHGTTSYVNFRVSRATRSQL